MLRPKVSEENNTLNSWNDLGVKEIKPISQMADKIKEKGTHIKRSNVF
jgi:hypothetical protein